MMDPRAEHWDHDPQVRLMRQVFAALEASQDGLLQGMGLSPLDARLGPARRQARACFNRAWPRAQRRGLALDPAGAAELYLCCLARGLSHQGLRPAQELLPQDSLLFALAAELVS